ncbi:hypothetical protein [Myceligenerans salitolerans]|uniref:ESX-1 secretion-associated protein EspA/EspE-like domain-containing protein n=1 Tax=Myceligenerans salitolerans TaxID=1230528 RepID=A0ABS3IBB5_9MICO|nr:hypothetical protein [Myceligenerans salitolerans]MBO0609347.1 hypothetical protein [Myceligenerans salitolerans]
MGIIDVDLQSELPPVDDFWDQVEPGEEAWSGPLGDVARQYAAARVTLLAYNEEPAEAVSASSKSNAAQAVQQLASAVAPFALGLRGNHGQHIATLKSAIGNASNTVAQHVRPQIRSGVVDIAKIKDMAERAYADASASRTKFADLVRRAEEVIDRVGVGSLAGHYEKQADKQAESARAWLWGVAVSGAGLVAVVIWLIVETGRHPEPLDWPDYASMFVTKALAIGALSYAVSFCSKNYRSHRHVEITYRQRMAALDTFTVMASSLAQEDDKEGRVIVLTELARAIFATVETGMTSSGSGDKTIIENTLPIMSATRSGT